MKYAESVVITPETNYSDIIVPTADTVRMSFLLDMLLTNKKPVSTVTFHCSNFFVENKIKCLTCAYAFPGAVYWANWHRKDPHHVRQVAKKHAP